MRNDSLHTKKAKEDAASFLVATHGSVQRTRSPLRGLHTHALTHARGQGHPRVDGGERCDVQLLYLDLEGGKKKCCANSKLDLLESGAVGKTVSRRRMIRGFLIDSAKAPLSFSLPRWPL